MNPDTFTVLLDAPSSPVSRMQIAKLGDDFEHGKYGKFSITADEVNEWKANLAKLPGGRALIDFDHQADRTPRNTEAAGWITGVELDGTTPMADIEWTPAGEAAIREKRYLFFSPTYGPRTDETGQVHQHTLAGGALTNRPFLNMPAITLASEERLSEAMDGDPAFRFYTRALDGELGDHTQALVTLDVSAAERDTAHAAGNSLPDKSYPINNVAQLKAAATLAASGHGNVKAAQKLIKRRARELGVDVRTLPGFGLKTMDSRGPMDKAILTALGLDGDTELVTQLAELDLDESAGQKLLDAIDKAKTPAPAPAPVKTLEQQATEAGQRLLDAATFTKLEADAAAGAAAQMQLHEQRFEHAFDAALNDPAGAKVIPAEKDSLHHFYTLDADATLKLIGDRTPIVPAKPAGAPVIQLDGTEDDQTLLANGVDPAGYKLHAEIQAEIREKILPQSAYMTLLSQRMAS